MKFQVFTSLKGKRLPPGPVLCLGNYDGVHRGHRKLFDQVIAEARRRKAPAVAVTFEPHPARVLRPTRAPQLLTTLDQKLALFEDAGFDCAFVLRFTATMAKLSPVRFIERVLVGRFGAQGIFVGRNFRFGRHQSGTVATLLELGGVHGYSVRPVTPLMSGGAPISSTRIRGLLMAGQAEAAARMLGRPYSLTGKRERGAGRGKQLGFPTLNFLPEQECLPDRGVYVTRTRVGKRFVPSVTNIGVRPTFGGSRLIVETHLLGRATHSPPIWLEVHLLKRLRGEQKFGDVEALVAQIGRDVARARRFHAR